MKAAVSELWSEFIHQAQNCRKCTNEGMVNVIGGLKPDDPWGLAWYDKHRNLDSGLMMVAMDFGNEDTVIGHRAQLTLDPSFEPGFAGEFQDRSYARLRKFLRDAGLADNVFVTNAALCVRPEQTQETGIFEDQVYLNCTRFLRAQINVAKPSIIVPLGGDALYYVSRALGLPARWEKITEVVGQVRRIAINRAELELIPFFHPRQGQRGWTDPRQLTELFIPLSNRLREHQRRLDRATHRELFGDIMS